MFAAKMDCIDIRIVVHIKVESWFCHIESLFVRRSSRYEKTYNNQRNLEAYCQMWIGTFKSDITILLTDTKVDANVMAKRNVHNQRDFVLHSIRKTDKRNKRLSAWKGANSKAIFFKWESLELLNFFQNSEKIQTDLTDEDFANIFLVKVSFRIRKISHLFRSIIAYHSANRLFKSRLWNRKWQRFIYNLWLI